jgi:hypothetical protein
MLFLFHHELFRLRINSEILRLFHLWWVMFDGDKRAQRNKHTQISFSCTSEYGRSKKRVLNSVTTSGGKGGSKCGLVR